MNRILIPACLCFLAVVPNPTCTPAPVQITPEHASLAAGEQQQFSVELREGRAEEIHWSILRGPGTISDGGLYRAPERVPQELLVTIRVDLIRNGERVHSSVEVVLRPEPAPGSNP